MLHPKQIVEDLLPNFAAYLTNNDARVSAEIAETNALAWGLDSFDDVKADFTDGSHSEIAFETTLYLAGEQHPDRMYCGDSITVSVKGTAVEKDGGWTIEEYEITECEVDD